MLTPLFLLLLVFAVSAIDIKIPDSIVQGGVITVLFEDGSYGREINASLGMDDEIFSKSKAFSMEIAGTKVDDIIAFTDTGGARKLYAFVCCQNGISITVFQNSCIGINNSPHSRFVEISSSRVID